MADETIGSVRVGITADYSGFVLGGCQLCRPTHRGKAETQGGHGGGCQRGREDVGAG